MKITPNLTSLLLCLTLSAAVTPVVQAQNDEPSEKPTKSPGLEEAAPITALKAKLRGTWQNEGGGYSTIGDLEHRGYGSKKDLYWRGPIRFVDGKTVMIDQGLGGIFRVEVSFKDEGKTLVWADKDGTWEMKRVPKLRGDDNTFRAKMIGHWTGLPGTNSESERITVARDSVGDINFWTISKGEDEVQQRFKISEGGVVTLDDIIKQTVTVEGNVMTIRFGEGNQPYLYHRKLSID